MIIKRHKIDERMSNFSEVVDIYLEKIPKFLVHLQGGGQLKLNSFNDIIDIVNINALLSDQPKQLIYTCLQYYLDVGLAHYRQVLTDQEKIEVMIGNEMYTIPKVESTYGVNANSWIKLFSIALIIKDTKKQEQLIHLHDKIVEEDQFFLAWVKYLVIIFDQDQDRDQEDRLEMLQIMEQQAKTDQGIMIGLQGTKKTIVKGRSASLTCLSLPLIQLYELVLANDEHSFNENLSHYLNNKKEFIIQKEWEGFKAYWIDFLAIACCSFAHEKGVVIDVESDYIPSWLYKEDLSNLELMI